MTCGGGSSSFAGEGLRDRIVAATVDWCSGPDNLVGDCRSCTPVAPTILSGAAVLYTYGPDNPVGDCRSCTPVAPTILSGTAVLVHLWPRQSCRGLPFLYTCGPGNPVGDCRSCNLWPRQSCRCRHLAPEWSATGLSRPLRYVAATVEVVAAPGKLRFRASARSREPDAGHAKQRQWGGGKLGSRAGSGACGKVRLECGVAAGEGI